MYIKVCIFILVKITMNNKNKIFWRGFSHSTKWDILSDEKHLSLIFGALEDTETGVEVINSEEFILFGESEALLLKTAKLPLKIGFLVYAAFVSLFKT